MLVIIIYHNYLLYNSWYDYMPKIKISHITFY